MKSIRRCLAALLVLCLWAVLIPEAEAEGPRIQQEVFDFLTGELGLNSAAACGVMANIDAESGFSLGSLGDGGTSFGLCQWHNSRWEALKSFCASQGYDPASLEGQLNYLSLELRTLFPNTYSLLKSVPDTEEGAYQAAYDWCRYYEKPANAEAAGAARGMSARMRFWPRFGGKVGPAPTAPAGGQSPVSFYWEQQAEAAPGTHLYEPIPAPKAPSKNREERENVTAPEKPASPKPQKQETEKPEGTAKAEIPAELSAELPGLSPLAVLFLAAAEPPKPRTIQEEE